MMVMFQLNHLKGQFCFVPLLLFVQPFVFQGLKLLDWFSVSHMLAEGALVFIHLFIYLFLDDR